MRLNPAMAFIIFTSPTNFNTVFVIKNFKILKRCRNWIINFTVVFFYFWHKRLIFKQFSLRYHWAIFPLKIYKRLITSKSVACLKLCYIIRKNDKTNFSNIYWFWLNSKTLRLLMSKLPVSANVWDKRIEE